MLKPFSIQKIIAVLLVLIFQSTQIALASSNNLKGHVVYLPENSSFEAVIQSPLDSELLANGDVVTAVISKNWKHNNVLIAPRGSNLYGRITDIQKAGEFQKDGSFTIEFDEIVTPTGKITLKTKPIQIKSNGKRSGKVIAKFVCGVILGTAVVGSLVFFSGGLAAPLAIGYFVTVAGSAGLAQASEKGNNVKIPAGTRFYAHLKEPTTFVLME